ncbi:MAG: glycosyltransferase, partial [Actinomycetes bacterium]
MSRVVQLANFVTPTSGGLRTALQHLTAGYSEAGHEVVQVLPGPRDAVEETPAGRRVLLRAPEVPGTGYRVLTDVDRVLRTLDALGPDRLEVHDRTTLRRAGRWARAHGIPSLVVSHERLDRWLHQWLPSRLPLDAAADRTNAALAAAFDTVVCTTAWAADEFLRIGVPVRRVPLGVDLEVFRPQRDCRPWLAGERELLLVSATRLSKEKRPDLAVAAAAELHRRGHRVRLVVAGDGPMRRSLGRQARGLPVVFAGHLEGRLRMARLLGAADVVLAPGPVETFGLAALEALACATPVVVSRHSALRDVVRAAGRHCPSSGFCIADAVEELMAVPEEVRRAAARSRAE